MDGHNKAETTAAQQAWGRERVELIKRTICPKGIGDDEFSLFIEQCKRSGLDPLLKEAFCVGRRQNAGSRERPTWVTRYEFQPSEAGMLARAERFPDFKGIQASAVYAEDEIIVDQGKGEVVHRFNPAKRKGALVGAWARVVREGKLPVVVWLDFSGYVQQTPLWAKIPTTMIEKCARVAALRKAYPEAFGGLYVREEMPAEEYEPSSAAEEPAPTTGTGTYEVLGARPGPVKASFPPLPAAQLSMEVQPPVAAPVAEPPPAAETAPRPRSSATVVAFGPYKGKTASELSDDELSETIDLAHEKLMEQPKAKWAKAMRENLVALDAETELRCRVPASGKKEASAEA
ncbi:phage recombination protein Bet [Stigmatella aurantiaca]|uniref:Phage recombination protein Bet n=1 Tax=Stigmatella aurantiaca (strain DW4/3-1) TaxID=378806 RepID=Q08VK7_STIAD|nr:phage recombination protein Bet [Stigmatella aurantiaca]ADO70623.1 Phage recombination protein Bet [Stigmatella aurantiaca DW4/3-1]EAU64512.1 some similarities to phage related proteins, putative [Stigmatella aurantiaca DW4/3-1]